MTNNGQPLSSGRTLQVPRPQARCHHHQWPPITFKVIKTAKAFSNDTVTWSLEYGRNGADGYMDLLDSSMTAMERYIQRYRTKQHALKFNMSLHANFEKAFDPAVTTVPPACLVAKQFEVYEDTAIEECLQECSQQLQNECYEDTGSGWVLSALVALDTTTVWLLDQLRASTYPSAAKVSTKYKMYCKC